MAHLANVQGCKVEFTAYRILYYCHTNNSRDMLTLLSDLAEDTKGLPAIEHALQVRKACALNNYVKFFKLHKVGRARSGAAWCRARSWVMLLLREIAS